MVFEASENVMQCFEDAGSAECLKMLGVLSGV